VKKRSDSKKGFSTGTLKMPCNKVLSRRRTEKAGIPPRGEMHPPKALIMMSGGLDSLLALRIMQEQGVEVEALHFIGVFHAGKFEERDSDLERFTETSGVKLTIARIEDDFIDILKNPAYGYGSNLNPCVDCRIYTLKKAREYMDKSGASFIVTGEVVGQRPMSQRRNMLELVEKKSGLEGLLLRPLSAKRLKPTIPEEKGWIDREGLFDINGRSRKPQMALAKRFGIKDYPSPAGGCLLTDPQFAARLRDLIKYDELTTDAIELLKVGRHFRLSDSTKAIVGRNRDDNARMAELIKENDIILKLKDMPGPLTVLRGSPGDKEIEAAGSITVRYSKARREDSVRITKYAVATDGKGPGPLTGQKDKSYFSVRPAPDDVLTKCSI